MPIILLVAPAGHAVGYPASNKIDWTRGGILVEPVVLLVDPAVIPLGQSCRYSYWSILPVLLLVDPACTTIGRFCRYYYWSILRVFLLVDPADNYRGRSCPLLLSAGITIGRSGNENRRIGSANKDTMLLFLSCLVIYFWIFLFFEVIIIFCYLLFINKYNPKVILLNNIGLKNNIVHV